MNVSNTVSPANPMSPEFELNVPASTPVQKPRGKRASNDAAVAAPVSAIDALALCMKDSALGG